MIGETTLAAVGLGANLPPARERLVGAVCDLAGLPRTRLLGISSLYRTDPWGGVPQPPFLNAVALLATGRAPGALLADLLAIEAGAGRRRERRWGPRTLDLDLLLHGDLSCEEPGLLLPHPRLAERRFVLVPLAELAPALVVPGTGATVAELLGRCADPGRVERVAPPGWAAAVTPPSR